jgi:hypothetical protein
MVLMALITLGVQPRSSALAPPPGDPTSGSQPAKADPLQLAAEARPATTSALWGDLRGNDEAAALRALLALASRAEDVLPLLEQELKPVLLDPQRAARWLADLDSADFGVRQRATEEWLYVGPYAELYLRKALEEKPNLELRRRIEQVLQRVAQDRGPDNWPRSARSLALLEQLDSPGKRQILERLARFRARARITQEAEAALDRLDVRLPWQPAEQVQTLGLRDPGPVARATLALAASPTQTVEYLRAAVVEVPPAPPVFAKRIAGLVDDLLAQPEKRPIPGDLKRLGIMARPALAAALARATERKQRALLLPFLKHLDEGWDKLPIDGGESQTPRMARLGIVLRHMDTPEARALADGLQQCRLVYQPACLLPPRWVVSPDKKCLVTVGADEVVCAWNTADAKAQWWGQRGKSKLVDVHFSQDGKAVLADYADRLTNVYDLETGKLVAEYLRQ